MGGMSERRYFENGASVMDEEFLQAMEAHAQRLQRLSAGPDALTHTVADAVYVLASHVRALQKAILRDA